MRQNFLLASLAVIAAAGTTLPVLAGGGMTSFQFGDSQADVGIGARGIGFLKIETGNAASSAVPGQQRRLDTSLFPSFEPYASLKPWVGTERTANRSSFNVGGVLVDVPLGNFVFTPSFGAGRYTEANGRDQSSAVQLRSTVELGYRFDDQSRLSLDYSHTSTSAPTQGGPVGGSALSFTYRIPSSRLLGE